ncbi:MAG: hypothetical protein U0574_10310 [Phycisphaerales bacterium]
MTASAIQSATRPGTASAAAVVRVGFRAVVVPSRVAAVAMHMQMAMRGPGAASAASGRRVALA